MSTQSMNKIMVQEEMKRSKQLKHHHQHQSLTRMLTLFAIVAVIIAQSVFMPATEARYLPTRSNVDQLKRQEIKEILRLLLDLPESEQRESQPAVWGSNGRIADLYELSAIRNAAGRHPPSAADMAVTMDGADSARAKRDVKLANKVPF